MLRPLLLVFISCCCWLGLSAQETACSFGLVLPSVQTTPGEIVTIDVTTRQFEDIVALQYRHQWDPQDLTFVEVIYNPDLEINASNFNFLPEPINQGILNFLYLESSLESLTLPDNTVLYSLRMEVNTAEVTALEIVNPADFQVEIIQSEETIVEDFYFLHASIEPEQAAPADIYPGITGACMLGQICNDPNLGIISIAPTGTEEFIINWSNSDGYSANTAEITGLNSSVYQLELTDANGLTVHGDFYLSSTSGLELTLAVDADECGGALDGGVMSSVSQGSGNYSYLWNTGSTDANLTGVSAGTYSLTVTDIDFNCSVSGSVTVESLSSMQGFFTSTSPSCPDSEDGELTINIDAGSGSEPFTYLWSNNATTATATNLGVGQYSVTVTDDDDCTAFFTQSLTADGIDFTAEVTPNSCGQNLGSIEIALSEDDYSFSWSNGALTSSIFSLSDGMYSVTITDNATSCTVTETYTIVSEELLTAYSVTCDLVDGNTVADITVAVWNNDDAPYTFTWSTGEVTTADQFSTITVMGDGTYDVTVTSANGCISTLEDMLVDCTNTTPSLYLTPENSALAIGQNICLSVRADQFTAISGLQFSLSWDENLLSYTGINNFALNGLSESNFNLNLTDDGLVALSWLAPDLEAGETLSNNSVLFDLCLQVTSDVNTNTNVLFSNSPTPLELTNTDNEVLAATTLGAQIVLNDGSTTGDVTFLVGDANVGLGEQFCVPLRANHFTNLIGHQLTLSWDETALQYTGVQALNLPNLDASTSFGTLAEAQSEGRLRMLWTATNIEGYSIANETVIAEVCYAAIGPEGTYDIDFSTDVLPVEAVDPDFNRPTVQTEAGTITIGETGQGSASLRIASAGVEPGQTICVPVEVVDFVDIVGMQFSINWDVNLLLFSELIVHDNLSGLGASNFNIMSDEGTLSLSWVNSILEAVTLAEGTPLFELCFTAQSTEGPAGVIFSSQPTAIEFIRDDNLLAFIPVNGEITISDDGLVWPGDTNTDGLANNVDLLQIGLGYGSTGAPRGNASVQWLAQYAPAWAEATPVSGVNYRHLDTNGDGEVNAMDTLALQLNWGLETENFSPVPTEDFFTGAPFYVQADTVQAGATAVLPIVLGVPAEEVNDAYGVAFTIRYLPEMITPGSVRINADGWLGTQEEDLLMMYRDYPAQGRVEVAMVRTDAQGQTGSGAIGEVIIIMEDVILRGLVDVEVPIMIEDVTLITYSEEQLPTAPRQTITLVEGVTNTQTPAWAEDISIQPNPTQGALQLLTKDVELEAIRLTDATGKLILELDRPVNNLDLNAYPAGVYYLQLQTEKGSLYEKIVKL